MWRIHANKYLSLFFLTIVVLSGLVARTVKLNDRPAGFFADEAAIGAHAYALLKTGSDYNGTPHPLFLWSFGVYRNSLPTYFTIPSVGIFGLNEFAVRLPFALAGTLDILLVFFLCLELKLFDTKKWNTLCALFTALFLSISPWHIHFSRFASENIFLPLFVTLSFLLFLVGLRRKEILLLSFISFGLTLYTYFPAWLISPTFLVSLCLIYFKPLLKTWGYLLLGFVVFLIIAIPLFAKISTGEVLGRWSQVKTDHSLSVLAKNYLAHFSPDFLFFKGDIDYPGHFITRFSSRGNGELYSYQLILFLIGTVFFTLKFKKPQSLSVLFLLLLYPLAGTLANTDGGGAISWRSILGVLPFNIIIGVGATVLIKFAHSKSRGIKGLSFVPIFAILLISIFSFGRYFTHYLNEYPQYSSDFWGWQYGPREVMAYFLQNTYQYDDLILYGSFNSPEIFIKFYDPTNRCLGKCRTGNVDDINFARKQLFAVGAQELVAIPPGYKFNTQRMIYYPNQQLAFAIGTFDGITR